jgi:biopolymer transport protein ExbB
VTWEWIIKGGWVMLPLLVFSVISIAVIIERSYYLLGKNVISQDIVDALEDGQSLRDIHRLIETENTILSRFLQRIDSKRVEAKEILEELSHSYFKKTWNDMEKRLEILNVVATTSPLLGLLGTVIGMVSIFQGLSEGALDNPMILSKGISEALITTITGLIVAVPALIAHTYFSKKIEQHLLVLEECGKLYIAYLKGLLQTDKTLFSN